MKAKYLRYFLMLTQLLLVLWLIVSCSQSEPVSDLDFLDEIQIGYVMHTDRHEPQAMLISREQGKSVTKQFNITATCPSWSSDYTQLAYADRGNIYVYDTNQMVDTVFETDFIELSTPVWSPNNNYLAFAAKKSTSQGGLDIWYLNLTNGDLQSLVTCTDSPSLINSCSSPAWVPDGRLGYVRHIGYDLNAEILSNIETLSLSSHETETLATELPIYRGWAPFGMEEQFYYDHYSTLAWSPDGSYVAFSGGSSRSDNRNIYILDTASKEILTISTINTYADSPVWLDSEHLIFRSIILPDTWEEGSRVEAYNIAIVNIYNKKIIKLTNFEPLRISGMRANPVISCPFWIPRDIGEQPVLP